MNSSFRPHLHRLSIQRESNLHIILPESSIVAVAKEGSFLLGTFEIDCLIISPVRRYGSNKAFFFPTASSTF
jgi:hypothetical protein